jgi:hypothetical protein
MREYISNKGVRREFWMLGSFQILKVLNTRLPVTEDSRCVSVRLAKFTITKIFKQL